MRIQDNFWCGFDLSKFLLYVLGQKGLSKQCAPDQTPQNAASDQGLHCLPLIQHFYTHSVVKWTCWREKYEIKSKGFRVNMVSQIYQIYLKFPMKKKFWNKVRGGGVGALTICWSVWTFSILWANSTDDKVLTVFLFLFFFPKQQDFTFVKTCFLGIIRKLFQYVVCWKVCPECIPLTRASPMMSGKQCIPWTDAAFWSAWSGSAPFPRAVCPNSVNLVFRISFFYTVFCFQGKPLLATLRPRA